MTAQATAPLPEPGFPQCLGVQLKPDNFTTATLEQVHGLGFRVVRRGFYWSSVERERGTYTFADYDEPMACARRLGLTVVGCLFGGNKAYEDHGRGGILTEEGRQGFARFAAAVAGRYRDQPVIWEVWNEPNVRTFWRKDGTHNSPEFADEYVALVKAAVPAMKAAHPGCFVVAGAVSCFWEPSYQWTEYCLQRGILESGIDGWSVHPYGVKTPEEHTLGYARTRQLLAQYGAPDLPILNTERGYAVKETQEGWSGGSRDRALEFQAWHFVRQALVDQLSGARLTVWYEWGGAEFGLFEGTAPRPVHTACRTLIEQLAGYRVLRRLEADAETDYIVVCTNSQGDSKLVAWTSPPPGGTPDEARPHEVDIAIVSPLPATTVTGTLSRVDVQTGAIRLTLTGAPQYVALPPGVGLGRVSRRGTSGQIEAASPSSTPHPPPTQPAPPPSGALDLKLFEPDTPWQFEKNTGDGSFALTTDSTGRRVGRLTYDFTRSTSRSTPYVLASVPIDVPEGYREIVLHARTRIAQQLTFRVTDATGQTLQFKTRVRGTGDWEPIRMPLTRKLEHWGGANDGMPHFPLKRFTVSVPRPGETTLKGEVEYSEAFAQ